MTDRRETAGAAPVEGAAPPSAGEGAAAFFGDRLPLARGFVEALATTGVEHGLIGPREVPRLWERHVLNCAVVEELVPRDATVVDIGSGAGLPGVALAVARPDLTLHLVEPMQRRTDWLTAVVSRLGLERVHVHHARAQDVVGEVVGEVATARAVTRLGQLTRWAGPLVAEGGEILAIKGASVAQELADEAAALRRAGVVEWVTEGCGAGTVDPLTTVARLVLGPGHHPGRPAPGGDDLRRGRAGKGRRRG